MPNPFSNTDFDYWKNGRQQTLGSQEDFDSYQFSQDMAQRSGKDPNNFLMSGGRSSPGNPMSGYDPTGGPEFGPQSPGMEAQAAAFQRAKMNGMLPDGATFQEFAQQYDKVNFKGQAFNDDHARQIMGGIVAGRKGQEGGGESREEKRERLMLEKEQADADRQKKRDGRIYQDAAGRDFEKQSDAIDQANKDRRGYADGASDAIDQRVDQSQQSGEDLIDNAERLMERGLKEFDSMAKKAIGDLNNQNMQFQAESTAGLRQSISGQISAIDRDPTLTPAQKSQMKSQMQNQVSSQVASVVGKAQRETQQLRAQMRTAFSGQRANLSQGMSSMVQGARMKAMEDNARSLEFAAQGRMALSELMSKPDRVLSEFDSLLNIGNAMESQGLDFDAGRFARQNFGDGSTTSYRERQAQNERFL